MSLVRSFQNLVHCLQHSFLIDSLIPDDWTIAARLLATDQDCELTSVKLWISNIIAIPPVFYVRTSEVITLEVVIGQRFLWTSGLGNDQSNDYLFYINVSVVTKASATIIVNIPQ